MLLSYGLHLPTRMAHVVIHMTKLGKTHKFYELAFYGTHVCEFPRGEYVFKEVNLIFRIISITSLAPSHSDDDLVNSHS